MNMTEMQEKQIRRLLARWLLEWGDEWVSFATRRAAQWYWNSINILSTHYGTLFIKKEADNVYSTTAIRISDAGKRFLRGGEHEKNSTERCRDCKNVNPSLDD